MKIGKWRYPLLLAAWLASPLVVAATINVPNGGDLNVAIFGATTGDTINLAPGDYSASASPLGFTGSYVVNKQVTIQGTGATPGAVRLHGGAAPNNTFAFFLMAGSSGSTVQNLTIDTSPAGIRVHDFSTPSRLHDITLKDIVVNVNVAAANPQGFGVLLFNNDRIVMDNVSVTAYQNGIQFNNTTDSLLMNSTVTSTGDPNAPGLAVFGGTANRIVGNTFGTPKANPIDSTPSTYSFKPGGVVLYNTTANRFENNIVQGFRTDGVDVTLQNPAAAGSNSVDNYVGKNTVISTGFAVNQAAATTVVGGTGIWTYCGTHNTWVYGNDSSGSPEGGLSVWSSNSNMALANRIWGNALGIFVSGDVEATTGCAYNGKPNSNYVRGNASVFNASEQIIIRSVDTSDVSLNFASPRNGRLGSLQPPSDATNGQSAITFQTLSGAIASSSGFRMVGNISSENKRGIWDDSGKENGIEFFLNRILSSSFSRIVTGSALTLDAGPKIGGNHWGSLASAVGNPSSTTPYSGVYQNSSNSTGLIVDHYPFQTEDLGRSSTVQVFEPIAGLVVAAGTKRTVRWTGLGCVYNDILLDGTVSLASDVPNTGYAVVTLPGGTASGSHNVVVKCKDSNGTVTGQATGPAFTVAGSALQLMTPGRDDVFDAGSTIFVGWKKTSAISAVNVKVSTDGGATFTTPASNVAGTFARIPLPAGAKAYTIVRVESTNTADKDSTDGYFALHGATGAGFTNVPSSRVFTMGQVERLEWASPTSSRLVTITVNGVNIANNLPDRGYFDWIPKDFGATAVTLNISFRQSDATPISSATASGTTAYFVGSTPPPPPPPDARLFGISTRSLVLTGDNVMIAGFIIGGSTPKTVVVRARGPSLGVPGALADPTLTLVPADGSAPTTNDDWQSAGNAAQLQATGFQPGNAKESAIMATLNPGAYTAIVSGAGGTVGVGIVEVYEIDHPEVPMIGISTRARVDTGDNVMIGGVIIQGTTPRTVVVRARGPSLGVPGALADPTLTLVPGDGSPAITNDNWQTASNAAQLQAIGFQPGDSRESALLVTLNPGAYTAIVSGVGGTTGVAIVEVYQQ